MKNVPTAEELLKKIAEWTPEEANQAWNAAVDMVMRDRAEEVEGMTPEELDAEMRAMGCDPAVERAKGWAIAAQHGHDSLTPEQVAKARESLIRAAPVYAAEHIAARSYEDIVGDLQELGRTLDRARGHKHAVFVWLAAKYSRPIVDEREAMYGPPRERTARQVLEDLKFEATLDDEMARVLAQSHEEHERELVAAGFDLTVLDLEGSVNYWAMGVTDGWDPWSPEQIAEAREAIVRVAPREAAERIAALSDEDVLRDILEMWLVLCRVRGKENPLGEWLAARYVSPTA